MGSQRLEAAARPAGYRPPQLHPLQGHLLCRKRLPPALLRDGALLWLCLPSPAAGLDRFVAAWECSCGSRALLLIILY